MLAKKPKGAVETRQGGGMASLLWMFLGALLTVICIVVLYLWNPFDMGSEKKAEEHTVAPITQPKNKNEDFEFYDLLPDQEMISLPDQAVSVDDNMSTNPTDLQPDVVITEPGRNPQNPDNTIVSSDNTVISEDRTNTPKPSPQSPTSNNDQDIVIVEEQGTYDDPTPANSQDNPQGSTQSDKGNGASQAATLPTSMKQSYILQINSYSNAEEADKRRAQVLMAGVDARVVKSKMANGQVVYQVVSPTMTNRQNVISAQQKLQNNGIDSLVVEQRR
ncbi:SPOR domain-containing protein [Psychrobacter sp.]|uniref:SPOR domain-containing protein n=1 Tax=Psychrobacter sp. TaxID=56811 RepID=UPI0025EB7E89|nr:SPOR domain-containing protein [Psychrobacter sp.]